MSLFRDVLPFVFLFALINQVFRNSVKLFQKLSWYIRSLRCICSLNSNTDVFKHKKNWRNYSKKMKNLLKNFQVIILECFYDLIGFNKFSTNKISRNLIRSWSSYSPKTCVWVNYYWIKMSLAKGPIYG